MRGHLSFGRYLMNLNYHMMNLILLLFGRALWVRNWIKQHWNTSFNDYSCKNWSKAVDKILGHLIFQLRVEIIVVCDSSLLVWSFYTVFVALVAHISGRLVSISKMYGRAKHHMMGSLVFECHESDISACFSKWCCHPSLGTGIRWKVGSIGSILATQL